METGVVVVRGGGDIATGTIQKLHRSGFKVFVTETDKPTSIRRWVCLSEAVYDGTAEVEDIKSVLCRDYDEVKKVWDDGNVPIAVDKEGVWIDRLKPIAVVDAILAKVNLGTNINMAPVTVALGPGFCAGKDVTAVIETMRGHDLGRIIFDGYALKNTGIPGEIGGQSEKRVIHSPAEGIIENILDIGSTVNEGDVLAKIGDTEVKAAIPGVVRGLIRNGSYVNMGLKIGDIDPRLKELKNCNTISDKARCIGGSVLEAIMYLNNKHKRG